ncbi:hypothetical protein E2C01_096970 [Portunus trituberculatus]|uniref:Uncharacterized protein n=1 Tax=Portunus trituberculatus TaxID=210409 RepID=A0A5B7JZ77_PORTR|nr:hypothetical protein [Portunus trituberculatus]
MGEPLPQPKKLESHRYAKSYYKDLIKSLKHCQTCGARRHKEYYLGQEKSHDTGTKQSATRRQRRGHYKTPLLWKKNLCREIPFSGGDVRPGLQDASGKQWQSALRRGRRQSWGLPPFAQKTTKLVGKEQNTSQ